MKHPNQNKPYRTFLMMLACSFMAMYFTMYLNTYELNHVYFSLTRFYMTCMGISAMAVIMWLFMRNMYPNKAKNRTILIGSFVLFLSAFGLVRTQAPIVGDKLWMEAMIPHHSIAILTSERANIQDPEVKELAKSIIEAQCREIKEMKTMINRLENEQ
ncbi:DUF305 domain-containing protein [Algoriphagus litoralis]|uniref:DUF305 domain-containing protein n=1 Tax=Algoriphagus litoralis TaxID=2202829 RepID=UPI000DB9D33B|nr:DUF305 domain-containing protein [Algoriphagus litoralis]